MIWFKVPEYMQQSRDTIETCPQRRRKIFKEIDEKVEPRTGWTWDANYDWAARANTPPPLRKHAAMFQRGRGPIILRRITDEKMKICIVRYPADIWETF